MQEEHIEFGRFPLSLNAITNELVVFITICPRPRPCLLRGCPPPRPPRHAGLSQGGSGHAGQGGSTGGGGTGGSAAGGGGGDIAAGGGGFIAAAGGGGGSAAGGGGGWWGRGASHGVKGSEVGG